MLEDHVVPFMQEWSAGFGLYGEQGMEGLHATINKLKKSFESIADPELRLRSMMKEHYMLVNPESKISDLQPKKRNLKRKHEE